MVGACVSCRGLGEHYGKAVQRHLLKGGGGWCFGPCAEQTVRPLRASQELLQDARGFKGETYIS